MALRFIEYIIVDGREVSLYIIQQVEHNGDRCFRIDVHDIERFEFILCNHCNTSWKIVTQTHPEFIIKKLLPVLTEQIEKRLAQERVYLSTN